MKSKWAKIILISLLCVVVFCMVATTSKIFTIGDLPFNFIAALLEAVITAVITVVLLTGQSAAEEVKERNVKVFELKAEIFQNYIDTVWKIWEDRNVSKEEYLELTSAYYKTLMIYLRKEPLQAIGKSLSIMGDCVSDSTNNYQKLRDSVFNIINTLSGELSLGGVIDINIYEELEEKIELCKK
jgi:cell shape-determining protein MreC